MSRSFNLEAASRLDARNYVLLVSGTMNPPHCGHVQLGLHAARELRTRGHTVSAICYVPVHDNYLHNKVTLKNLSVKEDAISADTMCFPMHQRCEMLRTLLRGIVAEEASVCHVLDYELEHGASLLEESPNYWAPKLPSGYLKTVGTSALITHFAKNSPFVKDGMRVAAIFGVDNLAGMSCWNSPASLLACADLVLVGRAMSGVAFAKDPSELLSGVRYVDVAFALPISFDKQVLFGDRIGSFVNAAASGDAALIALPALEGRGEQLSSTSIRDSVASCLQTLALHGYTVADAASIVGGAAAGRAALESMGQSAVARNELVVGR